MATPTSSGTSPSPALSYSIPTTVSEGSTTELPDPEQAERDERRRKILARTEFAKITRALRSTLALASYKAKHNVVNVPLRTLEAQLSQRASSNQTPSSLLPAAFGSDKKRKANISNFSNSLFAPSRESFSISHGGSTSSSGLISPSQHIASPAPNAGSSQGPSNSSKSLFASILALPPAKRARTIHNPEAPPVPPPPPPSQAKRSPKKNTKKGREQGITTRNKGADKKGKEKERKSGVPRKRAGSISSTHTRSSLGAETENVNDTDIKAAATLTDLFFSRTGGNVSPRSSLSAPTSASRLGANVGAIALSQVPSSSSVVSGSTFSDYKPSSHTRSKSSASIASGDGNVFERDGLHNDSSLDTRRSSTPTSTPRLAARTTVPGSHGGSIPGIIAPMQHTVDSEAADLMLLLANSPSPVRPNVTRDQDITRNAYAAGRVLFPTGSGGNNQHVEPSSYKLRSLTRDESFSSTASTEIVESDQGHESVSATSPPLSEARITSPIHSPELLAPLASQIDTKAYGAGSRPNPTSQSSQSAVTADPQTPATFHMADYINVSPSPATQVSAQSLASVNTHSALTAGSSGRFRSAVNVSSPLRKSFDRDGMSIGVGGRKLFENEPSDTGAGGGSGSSSTRRHRYNSDNIEGSANLGSGIDLLQT